jgi:hypothetical protein
LNELAPIVIFVYNRLEHTKDTISALQKNSLATESHLIIYSDAASRASEKPKVKEVRDYLSNISGFKSVHIHEAIKNIGCDNSIINGVSDVINRFGTVIVLEDDHVTSPNFLNFMNDALDFYKSNSAISGISGYSPPIEIYESYSKNFYVSGRGSSWGWATWVDCWNKIDWEVSDFQKFKLSKTLKAKFNRFGNDMSEILVNAMEKETVPYWDIRRCYYMHLNNLKFIYPVVSKVQNIGADGSGLHCGESSRTDVILDSGSDKVDFSDDIAFDEKIVKAYKCFYDGQPLIIKYVIRLLQKLKVYKTIRKILK